MTSIINFSNYTKSVHKANICVWTRQSRCLSLLLCKLIGRGPKKKDYLNMTHMLPI